jgi:hypothetical protein
LVFIAYDAVCWNSVTGLLGGGVVWWCGVMWLGKRKGEEMRRDEERRGKEEERRRGKERT